MGALIGLTGTMIPIAMFAMIALIVYFEEKRKAKEALYRNELLKKIADTQGDAVDKIMEMIRQEEEEAKLRKLEGIKLGGLITAAAGLGIMAVLFMLVQNHSVWIVGLIPLLIGSALVVYVQKLASKPERKR
jgi:hypothetical protein